MFVDLDHLDGSLITALKKEAVFRIPLERKGFLSVIRCSGRKWPLRFRPVSGIFGRPEAVALGQEDAGVHHLMLVLERGLHAMAAKVGLVSYQHTNWQTVINQIESQLKSSSLPPPDRDFYRQANAQFGFLKEAYRNHSAHTRDDPYDMEKALSILNHVRDFMQAIEKGGLAE